MIPMSESKKLVEHLETMFGDGKGPVVNSFRGSKTRERRLSTRELLAWQMRLEQRRMERLDFAVKTPKHQPFDATGEGGEEEEESSLVGDPGPTDIAMQNLLCPSIDDQLSRSGSSLTGFSIMEEIHEAKMLGTLQPHVEGTMIGAIQSYSRCPVDQLASCNEIMEGRRKEMLGLRARNDRALEQLGRRR